MGKSGIEIIEEGSGLRPKAGKERACPVCGAPDGLRHCSKCGWSIEDMSDPGFSPVAGDPVTTLRDARLNFKAMKEELRHLKEKNRLLIVNNQKFADLVEVMGSLISKMRTDAGKRYAYSYGDGGWGEAGRDGKPAIRLKSNQATIEGINRQLMEITHLINRYKK
jgi:hypothetical protein